MKTKFKLSNRILSFVLALVMVLGMMPMLSITAKAASSDSLYGFTVTVNADEDFRVNSVKINSVSINGGTARIKGEYSVRQIAGGRVLNYNFNFSISNYSCDTNTSATENDDIATVVLKRNKGHYCEPWKSKDDSSHTGTCKVCKQAATEGHTFSNDCDTSCNQCGYTRTIEHDYTYSASGNTITESCSRSCGYSVDAILTATDTYYTGDPIITGATITYPNGWQGEKKQPSEITDTEYTDNINAGTATVKTTVEGQELTATFKINPATITDEMVNLSPTSETYNGSAYEPNITVTFHGTPLVKDRDYIISGDGTGLTNSAAYTVRVVGVNNFTGFVDRTFTIHAASLTDIKVEQVGTLTYNGEAQTPTVSANATVVNDQPVTFTYSTEQDHYGSLPTFKEAGTYTVYYKATAPNHKEETGSFTVTVDKATVPEPTVASKEYNGEAQWADIPGSDLYYTSMNQTATNVGKCELEFGLKDKANYRWLKDTTGEKEFTKVTFEITKATNEWETEPTISDWTYGDTPSTPNYKAKFGNEDVVVTYQGTTNGGKDYAASTTPPTEAGNYTATFTVTGNDNYTALTEDVSFPIAKKTVDLSGVKWNYTEAFQYDGKSHGVSIDESTLPEGTSVSNYTGHIGTQTDKCQAAAAIGYDDNHTGPGTLFFDWEIVNNWTPTEYNVSAPNGNGWLNEEFTITPADGYQISTTNTADGEWEDRLTYSAETDNGSVTFYLKNITDGAISLGKTVTYKIDKTPATGKVEFVGGTVWEEFADSIPFDLFYNDEVTVKIEAKDSLSDVASIEYHAANKAMTLDEVKAITDWTAYTDGFGVGVEDAKQFVYFVRITDKAGNVTYLSTDGAEYDTTAPVISGIEDGETCYTTQKVTVTDKNIESITLNGETAEADITLEGNKEAAYTIVATDKAGNSTTVTVTMKPISDLSAPIDKLTKDSVNSGNQQTVDDVKAAVAAADTTDATEEEKAALKEIADKAAELEKVIDDKKALAELEKPSDSTAPSAGGSTSPSTGDSSDLGLWLVLAFASSVLLGAVLLRKKKKTEE